MTMMHLILACCQHNLAMRHLLVCHQRVITLGQLRNKLMGIGVLGSCLDLSLTWAARQRHQQSLSSCTNKHMQCTEAHVTPVVQQQWQRLGGSALLTQSVDYAVQPDVPNFRQVKQCRSKTYICRAAQQYSSQNRQRNATLTGISTLPAWL
jgi:hypothetical protein